MMEDVPSDNLIRFRDEFDEMQFVLRLRSVSPDEKAMSILFTKLGLDASRLVFQVLEHGMLFIHDVG